VPKTLKNFHCRVSAYDSGYACAATSADYLGYDMVSDARAPSAERAHAEWLDYSSTTYIECVLEDRPFGVNGTGPVTVRLAAERELYDAPEVGQAYSAAVAAELDAATRNFDCWVLLGYRIWNVGMELPSSRNADGNLTWVPVDDCVLYDESYQPVGTFLRAANYTGARAASSSNYTFLAAATPRIEAMTPHGMAGQTVEIRGAGFAPGVAEWDFHWRMDEFGFYTQPESPVVYIGGSPTTLVSANDTHVALIPSYNVEDVSHDVRVHVRGKGLAGGNKSFVYANYLYSISPRNGSLGGGQRLTIKGSGFKSSHTFYSDESGNDMGTSLASYFITLPGGTACDVVEASQYELECITRAIADDAYAGSPEVASVVVEYNYDPFRAASWGFRLFF
jgi:hypothetical protein